MEVAIRCMAMQTIANGSGRVIPTNSATIIPFSSADRRRKIGTTKFPSARSKMSSAVMDPGIHESLDRGTG
jgi:hypothetical protein